MFKRITLALMLAFFAATTVTVNAANPFFNNRKSARIDQSSKDAVVKTLLFG